MDSPFDVLGIDPDADEGEIVRAYRRRVKETHPDTGGSASEFQRVKAAYEEIRAGEGTDPEPEPRPEAAAAGNGEDRDRPTRPRVEYLNYEVLDDHGWALDDPDLFEKAADAGLDQGDYGRFLAGPGASLLESAEECGFAWPYACRGGACANCAVAVTEGELDMPANHVLPDGMLDTGIRLSCVAPPATDELKVVYNVKGRPDLDELRLPPSRFRRARVDD